MGFLIMINVADDGTARFTIDPPSGNSLSDDGTGLFIIGAGSSLADDGTGLFVMGG